MSKKREFQPVYSGDKSRAFWRAVNGTGSRRLYQLGCDLQSLEIQVLNALTGDTERGVGDAGRGPVGTGT